MMHRSIAKRKYLKRTWLVVYITSGHGVSISFLGEEEVREKDKLMEVH